ncbi:MAG: Divergent AAA domain protein [Acidobacteria bacterium ADurb.Bin051]|jgi:ATP-dependent DNA helicase RecG|nr:MAG: Divergent AAA domain protein [Acidobacteria bacterium ADurb.Bin051]
MSTSLDELLALLLDREDEHLEFKEARNRFDFEELVKYCAALANEGGGRMVLGVTDARPRTVVGTRAFDPVERTKAGLIDRLRLRIDVDELAHPDGRVLVFHVPPRPIGYPIDYRGAYWMRGGEDLVPMTPDLLQRIFAEAQPDFSAEPCAGATIDDLAPEAIDVFRAKWAEKSRRAALRELTVPQLLADAELIVEGRVTYAALALLGTRRALGRHLGQAEVIFEYRSDEASIPYQQRLEYREGFLLYHDALWGAVNLRNDLFSYQDGLFRYEIPAFNEAAVREAILNAVSHRDYRLAGSTFVRQWPQRIQIVSPGGFPAGVTPENILVRQAPRNRRLADALARCGLVERSGQGADRMFSTAVREGKLPPDFSESDAYQVSVSLQGQVRDPRFLAFLERLGRETQQTLSVDDLLVLDAIHRETPVPDRVLPRIPALLGSGALERVSRRRLTLSRRFYDFVGRRGEYTRRRGLDRGASKALLLQHIRQNAADGSPLAELCQVLPAMKPTQVQNLLRDLKRDAQAHPVGRTRAARWFPGPQTGGSDVD